MIIGEIGGPQEAEAALFAKENMSKPVIGYVAGLTAPKGRRMGHAGAIISAFGDTAAEKAEMMRSAGLTVAPSAAELGTTVKAALQEATSGRPMTARPKVVVTRRLPEAVEREIAQDFDATLNTEDRPLGAEGLQARAPVRGRAALHGDGPAHRRGAGRGASPGAAAGQLRRGLQPHRRRRRRSGTGSPSATPPTFSPTPRRTSR